MLRKRRGAYQHKVILTVEKTAPGRTVPTELREQFHRLLRGVWNGEAGACENRRPQLDSLLDRLHSKRDCRLPLVFDACYAAATTAMVEHGRTHTREEARLCLERQTVIRKRLERDHRKFQSFLDQPSFPDHRDLVQAAR
ncbi:MAG: hypothetical protein HY038_12615 [Nitrospirae bacterium]|nr:hypothetical protein [Nitrospirota bacterium]